MRSSFAGSCFVLLGVAALAGCGAEPTSGAMAVAAGGGGNSGQSVLAGAPSALGGAPAAGAGGMASGAGAGGSSGAGGSVPVGGAPALTPVFVAQGHEGRITRSCDDGQTFPYNSSRDDTFRCFIDQEHDCDHSEVAGRGLAFGQNAFVATWGWGHPGKLQRSTDGKEWADVMTETPTFADVAYGNSLFVACGNPTRISADGVSWQEGGKLSFDFNYRGIEYVAAGGGTFVLTGESGENRAISLSHDGKTWTGVTGQPATCGEQLRGIAGSDTVIVIASAKGHVCRSADGGSVWTQHPVAERFTSPPVWTGAEFWIYSGAARWKSSDGRAWTSEAVTPPDIAIGALARSPEGTLVAANDGWQVWYEKQHLFRSTDGLSWQVLPAEAFTASHPINFLSFGYLPATAGCGLP